MSVARSALLITLLTLEGLGTGAQADSTIGGGPSDSEVDSAASHEALLRPNAELQRQLAACRNHLTLCTKQLEPVDTKMRATVDLSKAEKRGTHSVPIHTIQASSSHDTNGAVGYAVEPPPGQSTPHSSASSGEKEASWVHGPIPGPVCRADCKPPKKSAVHRDIVRVVLVRARPLIENPICVGRECSKNELRVGKCVCRACQAKRHARQAQCNAS